MFFCLFFFKISFSLQKEIFLKNKKRKTEKNWTKFWLKKRLFLDQVLTLQRIYIYTYTHTHCRSNKQSMFACNVNPHLAACRNHCCCLHDMTLHNSRSGSAAMCCNTQRPVGIPCTLSCPNLYRHASVGASYMLSGPLNRWMLYYLCFTPLTAKGPSLR